MLGVAQCGSEVRKWRRGPGQLACPNPDAPHLTSGEGPRNLDIARGAAEVWRRVVSLCTLRGHGVRRAGGGLGFVGFVQDPACVSAGLCSLVSCVGGSGRVLPQREVCSKEDTLLYCTPLAQSTLSKGVMESVGLQAVTLSDGTTASIQQSVKGEKVIEEQVTETEDENTVYIHPVIVQKDFVAFEDGQPVVSEDRGMAYIPKEGFDSSTSEVIQLEDGSTTNIHCPAIVLPDSPILEVQAETEQEEKDDAFDVRTINALRRYANKHLQEQEVRGSEKRRRAYKAFRCGYAGCGRIYTTAEHLKVHERSHTGDRPYACCFPSCGKTFATAYGQKTHMKIHTNEKPFKCPEDSCSKAFRASGDLQKHIRTHTGVRPFKCPFEYCDRSFTTSHILRVHIRTHTGERPYTCPEPMCGRSFSSVTNYKNHIRIHTGEKPYACPVPGCGKCFTEYSSLYKHQVVHTRSRPYSCKVCGKAYSQKSTLVSHKCSGRSEPEATVESEEFLCEQQLEVAAEGGSPMKSQHVAFSSEMEKDKDEEEYDDGMPTEVSLISQDETEQISLSQEDLQALGSAVSVVIQSSALTVPEEEFVAGDMHAMTVVNTDGIETQPVTIVTSGAATCAESAVTSLCHQQVALLETANGAHFAVQLEEQQSLEDAISMAAAAIQHEPVTLDTAVSENGC